MNKKTSSTSKITQSKGTLSQEQTLRHKFYQKVLLRLWEMLKIAKQDDEAVNRERMQAYCQESIDLGKQSPIPVWNEILETAKQAIGNPHNSYRPTAMLIIKEIKKAADLIFAGEGDELAVSKELKMLLNPSNKVSRITEPNLKSIGKESKSTKSTQEIKQAKKERAKAELTKMTVVGDLSEIFDKEAATTDWVSPVEESAETILESEEDLNNLFEHNTITEEYGLEPIAEDIADLFDEDLFAEEKPAAKVNKGSIPGKETVFLFGEGFAFEEDVVPIAKNTNISEEPEEDFAHLFAGESTPAVGGKSKDTSTEEEFNVLEEIFGDDFVLEEESDSEENNQDTDIFGDDFAWEKESLKKSKKSKVGKETSILFGEDFSFDEDKNAPEINPIATLEEDEDIVSLFADNLELIEEKASLPKSKLTSGIEKNTDILFGEDFTWSEEIKQSQTAPLVRESIEPIFYIQFDELEGLLQQKAKAELYDNTNAVFDRLENLLDSPAIASTTLTGITKARSTKKELEDEFADLEQLLEQTDPALSGATGTKTSTGKSQQSRSRTPKSKLFEQTMRVPVKQLDGINNMMGELVVNRNSLEQDQERLRQFLDNLLNQVQNLSDVGARMQELYERSLLESSLLASRQYYQSRQKKDRTQEDYVRSQEQEEDYDPLEMDRFTGFHLLSQEMIELIVRVRESSSDIQFVIDENEQVTRNFRQVTSQLQEGLTKVRMVPFAQTADRLPRAVRDISLKLQKKAELNVEGREVLIDKMIVEYLSSPMTHLINNAMTHGIETPEVRKQVGKPEKGRISVSAFYQGNQTVITVADDGAGINPERVKFKALEKGLITREQAKAMTKHEVYELLFHPGFSTQDKADDFAGRGVGMDVVRTNLSEIRGTINIDSSIGKGTTFTIRLPLTLSISKALCCVSAHANIAFPMDGVEDMRDYPKSAIQENEEGQKCILWRETIIPIKPLNELFFYNRQISRGTVYGGKEEDELLSIVVLRSAGNFLAVQVDQVLGEQEIVIKQIDGPVPKPPGIAGATVLGDGRVMPIADVLELIEIAQGKVRQDFVTSWKNNLSGTPEAVEVKKEPLVLIVDDSITVRELLSMTFNKSGYRVEQARDGQEAWEKLRSGLPCDMIFCDIEMPRMDGLELLSRIQKDEKLSYIPIAMLTSRGAERHKQMAAKLGASGYFTKPYLEELLLEGAQKMLQGEVLLAESTRPVGKVRPQEPQPSPNQDSNSPVVNLGKIKQDYKVLLIDDSIVVREMLSMTFSKAGYQVEQARDGQEALNKLKAGLKCDVVFCDIEMPRMTGLDLLAVLQQDEELNKLPVAMLTSRGAERHRKLAAERGAKAYFTKPYMDEVLLEAAGKLIKGEVLLGQELVAGNE